ncbi:hypothetical protein GCM10028822_00270 [Hymenobacter terrigena]
MYNCPKYVGDIDLARNWHNGGFTPDIFSSCTNNQENGLNVPNNYAGSKSPISGNCYAGIVLYTTQSNLSKKQSYEVSESIWAQLAMPISPRKTYKLSFWVALADSSTFFSKYVTVTFSEQPFAKPFERMSSGIAIQVLTLPIEDKKNSSNGWIQVAMTFTPDKVWKYFSIGLDRSVFNYEQYEYSTSKYKLKNNANGQCYYYIDEINLCETENK